MDTLDAIRKAIIEGKAVEVEQGVKAALAAGADAGTLLNDTLIPAMAEVGRLYEEGEYFVPEMLIAARAMKTGLALLKPYLLKGNVQPLGKVAIATVQGDLHDIGKNLVSLMFEGAGFEIIDLGVSAEPQKFIDAVQQHKVHIVAMSALLTTTMTRMKDTIQSLQAAGLRDQVKVIVGGAPITQNFADEIGADGYAPDASQAVKLAKRLLAVS